MTSFPLYEEIVARGEKESFRRSRVNQLTQNGAIQYAEKGIRANCVLPGLMNTPMIPEPLKKTYAGGDLAKMIEIRDKQCPMKKNGRCPGCRLCCPIPRLG